MTKRQAEKILKRAARADEEAKIDEKLAREIAADWYEPTMTANYGERTGGNSSVSPTERLALNIPESVSLARLKAEAHAREMKELKANIKSEIVKLEYLHKTLIMRFYIDGWRWAKIAREVHCSIETCKRQRNIALELLSKLFEHNNAIAVWAKTNG